MKVQLTMPSNPNGLKGLLFRRGNTFVGIFPVLTLFLVAGCSTNKTLWKADSVTLKQRTPGWLANNFSWGVPMEVVSLEFTSIDLTRESTNVYRVRNYPTNLPVEFHLALPGDYGLPWGYPKIRLTAKTETGKTLCDFEITVPDPATAPSPAGLTGIKLDQLTSQLKTLQNYDLVVVVEKSSPGKAAIRLRGQFLRMPQRYRSN